jgi:hypothetical protein
MQEERNKNVAGVNEHTKPFYLNKVLQKQLGKKAALIYDGIKIRDLDLLYLNYFKDVKTLVLIFKHNKNKYFIVKIKPQQRQTDRANAHTGETHVTFYTITNITGVYLDEYTEIEEINRLINPEAAAAPAAPAPESPLVYALPTQEINGINVSFIFSKKAAAAAAAATRHPNIPNDYSAAGGRTRRRRTRTRTRKNKRV